jgi:ParB family chromosome partitioning protein
VALKRGLGKGLDALIPREEEKAPEIQAKGGSPEGGNSLSAGDAVVSLPLEKLKPNPQQPRKVFDPEELAELADSIREHGIIQPIIAEDAGDGTYFIIAGERRSRAAKLAGLSEAPVILRRYNEEKRMEVALIENIQRADLNPLEEAAAYKRLMEISDLSQDEVAAKVGKNRSTVANALRLLKLPRRIQESIQEGDLSPGHARAILSIPGEKDQDILFREILKKDLSVREAERRAAALSGQVKKQTKAESRPGGRAPELDAMEEKFIHHLGAKVAIRGDLNKGTIEIEYYSMEDLDRLYELLGG